MRLLDLIALVATDYTLRTVALGAAVLGIVSGALSSFAVLRRQSLLGDAMSHAALPGIALTFILTGLKTPLALMIGALIAGWLGALLVQVVTSQTRLKQDSALGMVLAVFFGLGMVLLSWLQGQNDAGQSGLDKFLFGRAAALVVEDVAAMTAVGGAALGMVLLFWKEFKLLSFDPDFAVAQGLPVRTLDILLTTLIVVAVVVGLQAVGVVLMSAMLVAPGAAARQWTDRLEIMVTLSALFGALAGVSGALISSLAGGLPTGPLIVLCVSALVGLSLLLAPNRGLIWAWLRQRRSRRRLRRAAVLEALYTMGLHHGSPRRAHSLRALRAAVPGRGVSYTLERLSEDGLVIRPGPDSWSLTEAGVREAEALLDSLRAGGQEAG